MTRPALATVGSFLLTVLSAPAPTVAQPLDVPEIRLGDSVDGTLESGGPTLPDRGPFTVFRFDAAPGIRYGVDLRSGDFDAYLILARPVGGITEFLRENDDAGGSSDSRLRFSVEDPGTYLLIVQAYEPRTGGRFNLSIDERQIPIPGPARPLTLGEAVTDRLTDASSVLLSGDEEIPFDLWTLEGRGGESLLISLDSDDFDAYLEFGPMSGGELVVTDRDDDGGGSLNAMLRLELPHDGPFGVRARPLSEGSLGEYTLLARTFTPAPALRRSITAGERVDAVLDVEDAVLDGGIHFQEWRYEGRAGQRIRITMRSTELDSYLVLGREGANGDFDQLLFNDDGPDGGLDAQVDFTLPDSGPYLIRARSYQGGARGPYSLEVERLP